MTVGTGIFLAAVILAAVTFYIRSPNKGIWKRWALRGGIAVIGLAIAIAAAWVITDQVKRQKYIKKLVAEYEEAKKPVFKYADISLSMDMNEVKYLLGEPTGMAQKSDNQIMLQFTSSQYQKHIIYVVFDKESRKTIGVGCSSKAYNGCPQLVPLVNVGTSEDNLVGTLGEPTKSEIDDDGLKKLTYEHQNIFFVLEKKAVTAQGLMQGSLDRK